MPRTDQTCRRTISAARIALVAALYMPIVGAQTTAPPQTSSQRPSATSPATLIGTYCLSCHNQTLQTAGLVLDRLDGDGLPADPETGEKVLKKVRTDAMPPVGRRRPDAATRAAFVSSLETALERAAAASPNPGRPASLHRLNRSEYVNAVRDLVALDIDGNALLPADDTGYGFDNIGDVLTLSPSLLDRYLLAADKISQLAISDPSTPLEVATYNVSPNLQQDDGRMSDDLPFGSRGGAAVRHTFPLNGEYEISLRLQRSIVRTGGVVSIRGLSEASEIDLRIDGTRIKLFHFGGKKPTAILNAGSIPPPQNDDAALVTRVAVSAGPRIVGVSFNNDATVAEGRGPARQAIGARELPGSKQALASVTITGPFNPRPSTTPTDTPARQRIFACHPKTASEEVPCARTILSTLARRAYRRPVNDQDMRHLLGLYAAGRKETDFDAGIRLALQGILSDLDFLVRVERDPPNAAPGGIYRISNFELASRLSFFLWSSIPDEELLTLAERGRLVDQAVLRQQVHRMLRDPRSQAFVASFFGQWLTVRNVRSSRPDQYSFPEFDENLRDAFQRETTLFLESQVREDRGVVDLLTADYTFLNERLAKHYGVRNVYGGHFRRVAYPDDRRAGILGHGSVLMVTSYATRTSPVLRGKWILENILGSPPPAPPAEVPPFKEAEPGIASASVRARLEQHRANPVCAGCHARMDPLGFALENFDAIGRWRTMDAHEKVDASGIFPTGERFTSAMEFRNVLVGHREEFVETVTEKLLTYAIGRGVEYYDKPVIRAVLREARASDYRWSALVTAVVNSAPFQMRKADDQRTALQAGSRR
jgi:mono/diheme cytochrome c family protein